jgi:hypothetical protein
MFRRKQQLKPLPVPAALVPSGPSTLPAAQVETGTVASQLLQPNFIRTPTASWSSSSRVPYSPSCRTRPDNKKTLARIEMTGSRYKERIHKKGRITVGAMFGLPESPEQSDDGQKIKKEARSTLVPCHACCDGWSLADDVCLCGQHDHVL